MGNTRTISFTEQCAKYLDSLPEGKKSQLVNWLVERHMHNTLPEEALRKVDMAALKQAVADYNAKYYEIEAANLFFRRAEEPKKVV